jgi:hypothetical protein
LPALSSARITSNSFPPGSTFGGAAHLTFNCAAAWMASYSFGATTPRKSFLRTTRAPGMCLIELSSTEMIGAPKPYTPCPRGRTHRPCNMPGTRMFWM